MGSYRGSLRIAATNDVIDAVFVVDEEQLTVTTGEETLGSWPLTGLTPDDTGTNVLLALDGERVIIDVPNHPAFVAALDPSGRKKKRRRSRKPKHERSARARRPGPAKPPHDSKRPKRKAKTDPDPEPSSPAMPALATEAEPSTAPEPAAIAEPRPEPVPASSPEHVSLPKPDRREQRRTGLADTIRTLLDRDTWRNWLSDRVVRWVIASVAVIIVALLALFATNSLGMILVLAGMVILVIVALAVSEDLTAYSWMPGNISETTLIIVGVIAMAVGGLLILIG